MEAHPTAEPRHPRTAPRRGLVAAALAVAGFAPGVAPQGPTGPGMRVAAWERRAKLARESPFSELRWRAIGPRFAGGRIESIACPTGSDATIYVGAGSGNVWKTENRGATWTPIFEHESTFAVGCVAVDPNDPDVVFVGTGEVLMARSSYPGTGVFKSVDGGATWRNVGLRDSHHIGRVLIDPRDSDNVYVAALGHAYSPSDERGVFKSEDGGETWVTSLFISETVGVVDVVIDPSDSRLLYAIAWERDRKAWNNVEAGPGSGVYRSTDAGQTWQLIEAGLPRGDHVGRIGLACSPSNPKVVYALVDSHAPADQASGAPSGRRVGGEVYRSDDRGISWRKVNQGALPARIGYDLCLIRVSPSDPNEVWVLGSYLLRSVDGGETFERVAGTVVDLLPHGSRVLHLDHHELWIDPENAAHLLLGTDGGLYSSSDRGRTWLRLNNLPITEVYAVTVDMADPYRIYIGTQDNAALIGTADGSIADGEQDLWKHVYLDRWGGGDSFFTYVDPTDPDTIYYEHQFGDLRRKNMRDGKTVEITPRAADGEPALRRNWMTPFCISHHDRRTLYYGANRLFESKDRGDTWVGISPDLTGEPGPERRGDVPFGTLTSISESPLVPGMIFTGSDDGLLHRTRDGGRTWDDVTGKRPRKWVSRVVASRHDAEWVYVACTGYREDDTSTYLFASSDVGDSWRSIGAGLPAESVNVVCEDPADKNVLYVGTDLGVYVTIDRGQDWFSLCADLPTTPVHDMVVHPRESELVIGTHGRGVFVLDVTPIRVLAKRWNAPGGRGR